MRASGPNALLEEVLEGSLSVAYAFLPHRVIHFAFTSVLTVYIGNSPLRACTTWVIGLR